MRKLLPILALMVAASWLLWATTEVATDNFDSFGDYVELASGNWDCSTSTTCVMSQVHNVFAHATYVAARWKGAGTFNSDQYASITAVTSWNDNLGPAVRISTSANSFYMCRVDHLNGVYIASVAAGTPSDAAHTASVPTFGAGLLTLEVTGDNFICKANGTEVLAVTISSSRTDGTPGLGSVASTIGQRADNWAAGNMVAAGVRRTVRITSN